jgi:hypothetical protein
MEQHLQAALADLRLVRRIGRVPCRIFEQVALDHRRDVGAVVAHADEASRHLVPRQLFGQFAQGLRLAGSRREIERPVKPDGFGYGLGNQGFDRGDAKRGEHRPPVGAANADMAL